MLCLYNIARMKLRSLQIFWLLPLQEFGVVDVALWFMAAFCSLFAYIRVSLCLQYEVILFFVGLCEICTIPSSSSSTVD